MWIEKSKDKFRLCAYYTDPLTMARHKVGVTIEKDTPQQRNKAKEELDRLIMIKSSYAPEVVTLDRLINEYREYQKQTVKLSTYRRNYYVCSAFLNIFGHNADVNRLSARIVKSRMLSYNSKPVTYNEYMGRFKALMRWGYRNDLVRNISWLEKLDRLKDRSPREKVADKFLERSECDKLLSAMKEERWRWLTEFLLLSGLRIGEALALEMDDINTVERTISVTKTLDPNNNIVSTPKTPSSTRKVFMQDELVALSASLRRSPTLCTDGVGLYQLLSFPRFPGFRTPYYAYRKYLKEVSKKVLGKPVTPHVLRHTHASLLAEQGLPYDLISRRLGHDNSKITRDIYIHITEQRKKQDNDLIKSVNLF